MLQTSLSETCVFDLIKISPFRAFLTLEFPIPTFPDIKTFKQELPPAVEN